MEVLGLLLRVVLSLAVVLGLLWLAARGLRKNQRRAMRGIEVDVLARQPLAQRSSIAVVQVGDRALVLGVTENRVELLTEAPLHTLVSAPDEPLAVTDITVSTDGTELAPPAGGAAVPVPQRLSVQQPARGPLAGSALSPATWAKAIDTVRELTVRR